MAHQVHQAHLVKLAMMLQRPLHLVLEDLVNLPYLVQATFNFLNRCHLVHKFQ
jgi:hypothetical protein